MNTFIFFLVSIFWGFSFIAIKAVVVNVTPIWSASIRVLLSFLFLNIFIFVRQRPCTLPKDLRVSTWISGLCYHGVSFALLFWGEQYIPAGLASIINGSVPLWTALFAYLWIRHEEQWSLLRFSSIILGFIGLLCIFAPQLSLGNSPMAFFGTLAVLGMALSYSCGNIIIQRNLSSTQHVSFLATVYHQHSAALCFLIPCALLLEGSPVHVLTHAPLSTWLSLSYLGLCSTALAAVLFLRVMKQWGSVKSSLVTYVIPVVSLTADFFINGTVLSAGEWLGGALILLSLAMMQIKWGQAKKLS